MGGFWNLGSSVPPTEAEVSLVLWLFFFLFHFPGPSCEGLGLQHGLAQSLVVRGSPFTSPRSPCLWSLERGDVLFAGRVPAVVDLLDSLAHVTWLAAGASCAGRLSSWRGCLLMSVFSPVSRSIQFSGGLRRGQAAF